MDIQERIQTEWTRRDGLNAVYEREYPHPCGEGKIVARIERVGGFQGYWRLEFFGAGADGRSQSQEFPNLFTHFRYAERMADFCAESDSLISICRMLEPIPAHRDSKAGVQ